MNPNVTVAMGGRCLPVPTRQSCGTRGWQGTAYLEAVSSPPYRFAAKTVTSGSLVLITLERREGSTAQLTINSEKMVIGTMLVKDIIQALAQ